MGQMADNDILNSLKGMLGDNADEKINSVMNMLKGDNNANIDNDIKVDKSSSDTNISKPDNSNMISPESLRYISQIKSIIDEMGSANDPRSNLLMSLRPYMNETRQKSIDNAVKILNLSRISGLFRI